MCWAYQTGFILYQTIIIKLFNSTFTLTILDCIYSSICCILIFLISNKIFKSKISSFLTSLLYSVGFFSSAYCGVLTNQHLFTTLILFSVYIVIAKERITLKQSILLGLLLAVSNIIRTEAIIYLLGFGIYLFLNIKNKYDIKRFFINLFTIFFVYFTITQGTSFIIQKTGINQNGLANKNVLWKFVCGLDYNSGGQYSKKGEEIFDNYDEEINFILGNLKMPLKNYINLSKNKIITFWQLNDYNWVLQNKDINIFNKTFNTSELVPFINMYDKLLSVTILIFLLIHLVDIIIKKQINSKELLLILMIIINFFVYLIIEVQSRYSYTIKVFIYVLATGGINYITNMLFYRKGKIIKKGEIEND